MIFGDIDDKYNVTIRFNAREDSLAAGVWGCGDKWHPCAACGIIEAVTPGILHFVCDACAEDLHDPEVRADRIYEGRCSRPGSRLKVGYIPDRRFHDEQIVSGFVRMYVDAWLRHGLRQARREAGS